MQAGQVYFVLERRLRSLTVLLPLVLLVCVKPYPTYPAERAKRSLDLLLDDLERQFGTEFSFTRSAKRTDSKAEVVVIPIVARRNSTGVETWITLSSPLAPGVPINSELWTLSPEGMERLRCADDLVARRHLPEASLRLRSAFK